MFYNWPRKVSANRFILLNSRNNFNNNNQLKCTIIVMMLIYDKPQLLFIQILPSMYKGNIGGGCLS